MATEKGSEIFLVAPCPRLKTRDEKMVVARGRIPKGTVILSRTWTEYVRFVALSKEEAAAFEADLAFTERERNGLAGGIIVSPDFLRFSSPSHLQLTCMLIFGHSRLARQWVEEKTFLRNRGRGLGKLTVEKHQAAIQWLRAQGAKGEEAKGEEARGAEGAQSPDTRGEESGAVALTTLMFWAVRENFLALYEMVLCNALTLSFALSATDVGLVFCPQLAMFNHDCVPNAFFKSTPQGYKLVAIEDIQDGDEICYSYEIEPVGLVSGHVLEDKLFNRFGFHCKCPTHLGTRPLYRKRVVPPTPLSVLYYKNRLLDAQMDMLQNYYRREEWDKVRSVCEMLATSFFPLIRTEGHLAFVISYYYAMSVPYCTPTDAANKWLLLLVTTVTQYCANPLFIARAFFLYILHLVRKANILVYNSETKSQEPVLAGCQGQDLNLFMVMYMNLRTCLRRLDPNADLESSDNGQEAPEAARYDRLIVLESYLFGSLNNYLEIMEEIVQEAERDIQALKLPRSSRSESVSLSGCDYTLFLVNNFIDGSHLRKISSSASVASNFKGQDCPGDDDKLLGIDEIETMMLHANYINFPNEFNPARVAALEKEKKSQRVATKKKNSKKKKSSSMKKVGTNKQIQRTVGSVLTELNRSLTAKLPGAHLRRAANCPPRKTVVTASDEDVADSFFIYVPAQYMISDEDAENLMPAHCVC